MSESEHDSTDPIRQYTHVLDEDLIAQYADAKLAADTYRDEAGRLGHEIQRRMLEREATRMPHAEHEVTLEEGSPTWDYALLSGLREITSPSDLAESYTPEHHETVKVPEKWNMTKAKKLAKFGAGHATILENARIPGAPRLKVERKPDAPS